MREDEEGGEGGGASGAVSTLGFSRPTNWVLPISPASHLVPAAGSLRGLWAAGVGRCLPERVIMACRKGCSDSQIKWVLAGTAIAALVLTVGIVLSLKLQQPGRGLLGIPTGWLSPTLSPCP